MTRISAPVIKPVGRQRGTTLRWTTHQNGAGRVVDNLDLTAGNSPLTQNADALIIKRLPFSARIGCLQEDEFFFGQEVRVHDGGSLSKSERPRPRHQS